MGGGQIAVLGRQNNSTNGASINDIFYFPGSVSNMSPYYTDSSSNSGFTAGSNLAWCTGTCGFLNRTNGGSFTADAAALAAFYPRLGDALKQRFSGWTAYLFSGDPRLPKLIGLKPSRRTPLFNGALECRLYEYRLVAGSARHAHAVIK